MVFMTSCANTTPDIIPDPSCSRNRDPDVLLGNSSGPEHHHGPSDTTATQIGIAPVAARPSDISMVAFQTLHIHTAPGGNRSHGYQPRPCCCWAMDPDMVHSSNLGTDDTMTPCSCSGHQDRHGPMAARPSNTIMAKGCLPDLGHHCGPCSALNWPRTQEQAKLADQQSPGIHLSLRHRCWHYKHTLLCLAFFYMGSGDRTQVSLHTQHAYQLSYLPSPHYPFFLPISALGPHPPQPTSFSQGAFSRGVERWRHSCCAPVSSG